MTRTGESTRLWTTAMLIRGVEQRLLDLFAQGKLFGTVHTCIGQEWVGIAVAEALEEGDLVFSSHRCHGHFLARTGDVEGLIAEIMGRETGVCGGRGGSQHICSNGFFSNGVQGGIVPVSAGLSLAQKLEGRRRITTVFVGDGTLGEGALYEGLNIASKWQLPLLIVLENNLYAQSTHQRQTLAGDICARAAAFDIETGHADTWHPDELLATVAEAARWVRHECRPFFLRVDTYRLMAHSKGDDDRDPEEVGAYWEKDPVTRFVKECGEEARRIQAVVDERIDGAVARAESAPLTRDIGTDDDVPEYRAPVWTPVRIEKSDRVVNRIYEALRRNMERDPRILIIGEDLEAPYGGAFKVTKDLSERFPGRVRNTPISEAAIVGLGNGLAMRDWRPVCEIMFGDFLALAADQFINYASKFEHMYNQQVRAPLIIRTPMGGKRGYGPTHSQSLEKHFMGVPGTIMLAIHHRHDPAELYDRLLATVDRPTIVIENKLLYATRVSDDPPPGWALEHSDETFPTTRLRPEGRADVTILCYGGMLGDAEEAVLRLFDEQEVICEILCPAQLYPLNPWPIAESVGKTGRLLVVEEGVSFAAFGSEVVAQVMESVPGAIRRVRRLGSPRHPIPSCKPLEQSLLPGAEHIVAAVTELVRDE